MIFLKEEKPLDQISMGLWECKAWVLYACPTQYLTTRGWGKSILIWGYEFTLMKWRVKWILWVTWLKRWEMFISRHPHSFCSQLLRRSLGFWTISFLRPHLITLRDQSLYSSACMVVSFLTFLHFQNSALIYQPIILIRFSLTLSFFSCEKYTQNISKIVK